MMIQSIKESSEATLPEINLQKLNNKKERDRNRKITSISVKKINNGLRYFLDDKEVKKGELEKKLRKRNPQEVIIRADELVNHGAVVTLMSLCQSAGIHNISFAYSY